MMIRIRWKLPSYESNVEEFKRWRFELREKKIATEQEKQESGQNLDSPKWPIAGCMKRFEPGLSSPQALMKELYVMAVACQWSKLRARCQWPPSHTHADGGIVTR